MEDERILRTYIESLAHFSGSRHERLAHSDFLQAEIENLLNWIKHMSDTQGLNFDQLVECALTLYRQRIISPPSSPST